MSATDLQLIISAITLILSIGISAFISGTRWGEVKAEFKDITVRLAKIEGMFTLRLKDDGK